MYRPVLGLFMMVVCVFLLISGCGGVEDSASTPQFTPDQIAGFVITPGEGWGPITFSTPGARVEQILGPPERRLRENALEYMSLGMAMTVSQTNQVNQILFGNVCALSLDDPLIRACAFKTAAGIGMLSTRDEIVAAYGQPSTSRGESDVEEMQYRELGAVFTLRGNRLVHIGLRRPPQD